MSDTIKHTPVKSSHVASIGYHAYQRIMEVKFQDGSVWQYSGVPFAAYQRVMQSKSIGNAMHNEIKPYFKAVKVN